MVKHVVKCEKWACSTLKAGKNKPIIFIAKTRDFARVCEEIKEKTEQFAPRTHLRFLVWVEHCVKLGVYARRVANKTSRSAERGRRRQNLRYPVKSHSQKRQIIADFCRFLLALLTSRRKNRHLEGFYLLTLQPQVCRLWRHLVWQNDRKLKPWLKK